MRGACVCVCVCVCVVCVSARARVCVRESKFRLHRLLDELEPPSPVLRPPHRLAGRDPKRAHGLRLVDVATEVWCFALVDLGYKEVRLVLSLRRRGEG